MILLFFLFFLSEIVVILGNGADVEKGLEASEHLYIYLGCSRVFGFRYSLTCRSYLSIPDFTKAFPAAAQASTGVCMQFLS